MELLREYARQNSESAFAELVSRRIGLVYSAALRQVRDPDQAAEITQAVFILLAQKAGEISDKTILTGWLFKTTRFTALAQMRNMARRRRREQEFHMHTETEQPAPDELWEQVSPLLDEALGALGETDRQALLLRYFEDKNLTDVGRQLGMSEDTARKRVGRALDKLHRYFSKRGVRSTGAILATLVTANSIQAAPAPLAASIAAVATAKGAAAGSSSLALIKGALKLMAWTKAKTTIVVGIIALVAATSTTVVVVKSRAPQPVPGNRTDGLSPTMETMTADIQSDGSVRFEATVEEVNRTSKTVNTDRINDSDTIIDQLTDESGNAMQFTQTTGSRISYLITLNKPVPPGGKVSYKAAGRANGMIKSDAGVCRIGYNEYPGNDFDMRRITLWRLPVGATLLEKNPAALIASTNGDQVELRIDRVIPPQGQLEISFSYKPPTP